MEERESEYNTPILPVKKTSGEYRLVQGLKAINQIMKDIHSVVANPHTLLTALRESNQWFTVLDLKDAFFCIPLEEESRKLFAFEWENPQTGRNPQLTWTRLPQGFKNSPTIFGSQLAKELETWKHDGPKPGHLLLQYVDDIPIATEERPACIKVTTDLLNFWGLSGYKVSRTKAQIANQTVIYLGFEISQGQRQLGTDRKEAICSIPELRNTHELRTFWGMAGWCQLWIMNYGLLAKPLYEALKGPPFEWGPDQRRAFQNLKLALMTAPALGLPDLTKDFQLFVHKCKRLCRLFVSTLLEHQTTN